MRPLHIDMTAFGPYAAKQSLDFADLQGRSFFLIHGETGAGKTSILDAMCFALYGDTSGGERTGADMRSRFADDTTETEVVFDFALGADAYRVRRTPQQMLAGRGGKLVKRPPNAELWRLDGGAEGELLASGVRETAERARELIGFSSEQFRQVVMLPQGRFRELLSADSRRREEIMRQLFRTDSYGAVEDQLRRAKSALDTQLRALTERADEVLGGMQIGSRPELDEELAAATARVTDAETAQAAAHDAAVAADAALQAAESATSMLAERDSAAAELAGLEARAEEMAALGEKLAAARRAQAARAAAALLAERRRDLENAISCRDAAATALASASESLRACTDALAAEELRAEERARAEEARRRLDDIAARLDGFLEARQVCATVATELCAAENVLAAAEGRVARIRSAIAEAEKLASVGRDAAGRMASLSASLAEARRVAAANDAISHACGERDAAASELADADVALEAARASAADARRALEQMEERWRDGQAAVLAEGLTDGEPCPVCGSIHHPSLAEAGSTVPSDAELAEAKSLVESRDASARSAAEALAERREALGSIDARLGVLREQLPETPTVDVAELEAQLVACEREAAACVEAEAEQARLGESLPALVTAAEQARSARDAAAAEAAAASATETERAAGVPDEYRDRAALSAAIADADGRVAELRRSYEHAIQALAAATEAHARAQAADDAARATYERATADAGAADEAFAAGLSSAGFADETAYREATLEQAEVDTLDAQVREHERALAAAKDRAARAVRAADGVAAPDLDAARAVAAAAAAARDEATRGCEAARKDLQRLEEARDRWESLAEESADLRERYANVARLADAACGDNPLRLSFQRYVLGTFLDEVLRAATRRLAAMSKGRYRLYRARDAHDRRRAAGLDLEVFDEYTGDQRPVSTLSGGEGFLASLALALGLAEVVQSFAGGTRLDTIFVDEGFGTLDPETLDEAIATLMELQGDGRLVGIISHVPELRQLIDCRLVVAKTARGSTARFDVG